MDRKSPEFTAKELNYLQNTDFLRTKRSLISGFIEWFEKIQVDIIHLIDSGKFQLPDGAITRAGKITKGENYKDLPFVVLDCPRFFSKNDIFAYRSIFWWGNYLSNHFLLKGHYLDLYRGKFSEAWPFLREQEVYLDLSNNPWNHDLSTQDYVRTSQLNTEEFDKIVEQADFLKLVWRMELDQWKDFHQFSLKNFLSIHKIMNI